MQTASPAVAMATVVPPPMAPSKHINWPLGCGFTMAFWRLRKGKTCSSQINFNASASPEAATSFPLSKCKNVLKTAALAVTNPGIGGAGLESAATPQDAVIRVTDTPASPPLPNGWIGSARTVTLGKEERVAARQEMRKEMKEQRLELREEGREKLADVLSAEQLDALEAFMANGMRHHAGKHHGGMKGDMKGGDMQRGPMHDDDPSEDA